VEQRSKKLQAKGVPSHLDALGSFALLWLLPSIPSLAFLAQARK
jgi:hypothetical protein